MSAWTVPEIVEICWTLSKLYLKHYWSHFFRTRCSRHKCQITLKQHFQMQDYMHYAKQPQYTYKQQWQQQHPFNGPLSGTTWVSRYQKSKTNLDLLEQDTISGSGISWTICKSAPHLRHASIPLLSTSVLQTANCHSPNQTYDNNLNMVKRKENSWQLWLRKTSSVNVLWQAGGSKL